MTLEEKIKATERLTKLDLVKLYAYIDYDPKNGLDKSKPFCANGTDHEFIFAYDYENENYPDEGPAFFIKGNYFVIDTKNKKIHFGLDENIWDSDHIHGYDISDISIPFKWLIELSKIWGFK